MTKVVINACFGGFGLSEAAYEKLIEWGVPVRRYAPEERGQDGCFLPNTENDGEVIFDRNLDEGPRDTWMGRYWDAWTRGSRSHPLIVRVVEELGEAANGEFAKLRVVRVPDDVQWFIDEYDGNEHVAEKHQTWS